MLRLLSVFKYYKLGFWYILFPKKSNRFSLTKNEMNKENVNFIAKDHNLKLDKMQTTSVMNTKYGKQCRKVRASINSHQKRRKTKEYTVRKKNSSSVYWFTAAGEKQQKDS